MIGVFALVLVLFSLTRAAFYCGDTGLFFSDQTFCDTNCSSPCQPLLANDQGRACDSANYELFVYNPQTNKTIAISKGRGFWDEFNNLLVISDASDNSVAQMIVSYVGEGAWIGLYDPNLSASYNSVNPSRFVWVTGNPVAYTNWGAGEPDNKVDSADIGTVSPLGEHWVYIDGSGTWKDDGLHVSYGGDYRPRRRALVMWEGQLDCVNGLPQNDQTTTSDMVNLFCGGNTPCFLCTDGSAIEACSLGTSYYGSYDYIGSGVLSEVSFSQPLEGRVILRGTGTVEYCNGTCPRYGNDALINRMVFRGDDGKLYVLSSSPNACTGNLTFEVLSYTEDGSGNLVVDIPSGVRLVSFADVESVSGQCTADNRFNFSLTVLAGGPEWLCPIQNNCSCPGEGVWDDNLKKCVDSPNLTCTSAFYTLNGDVCEAAPQCLGGTYDSVSGRCEAPATPVCPPSSFYDGSQDVCYREPSCPAGYIYNATERRCERPATVNCDVGVFNTETGMCEYDPICPVGSVYVPERGRCEEPPTATCSIGTFDPTDGRFEWSPSCEAGQTYNPSTDRCEWSPVCRGSGTLVGSRCEAPAGVMCPYGYSYNSATGKCEYLEILDATPNCPAGYTYNPSSGMCEVAPVWECKIEKSGCVNPPEVYTCTGGNCSSGGYSFGASCEVDPGCGLIGAGQSCTDGTCEYRNLSSQVCPLGNCQVAPSWSCPNGYTLNGNKCERLIERDPVPTCEEGYTYDSASGVCAAVPDCGGGTFDGSAGVCWRDVGCGGGFYDPSQDVCWSGWLYSCTEGFTFDAQRVVCWSDPVCPEGVFSGGKCQVPPITDCVGATFDASSLMCVKSPLCGAGFTYDSGDGRCEAPAGRTCSVGSYDPLEDVCVFDVTCPDGGTFDGFTGVCKLEPQRSCDSPYTLDGDMCVGNRVCEGMTACVMSEVCVGGGSWNAVDGVCELPATPVCPDGGSYDSASGKCTASVSGTTTREEVLISGQIGGKAACRDRDPDRTDACGVRKTGTLNLVQGSTVDLVWSTCCVCDDDKGRIILNASGVDANGNPYGYSKDQYCPSGGRVRLTDNSGSSLDYDVAYYDTWGFDEVVIKFVIAEPACPNGYTYNPTTDRCEANPTWTCSDPAYTYNPSAGRCEAPLDVTMTCPIDPSLPCIQHTDGNYYCTTYQCRDATQFPPENTDTQQGANDIPADGQVTDQGCVGTVYVFNGRDMRCRPPGTQTGFSNCCKKTRTWLGLGQCNETERQLAALRSWGQLDGNCYYVGEYCAEWWGPSCCKVCVQKKKTYCCFNSPLARIIHEQGRPQLGIGWGTPEAPNCRGFTMEEFQKLDFSKIDFSEWIEEEVRRNIAPQIEQNITNIINQMPSQFGSGP